MGRIIKISGKSEQEGKWSNTAADFVGYILFKDNFQKLFIGYTEEKSGFLYGQMQYISGMLLEEKGVTKLFFLKMSARRDLLPLLYTFKNITREGVWTPYSFVYDFNDDSKGAAKIVLEELGGNPELADTIDSNYERFIDGAPEWDMELLLGIEEFRYFI